MSIYDAAMKYQQAGTPLGCSGRTGIWHRLSSRDWAAKGTNLLGVKAVVAQSFERIHRSNLVGMGVLPLQFKEGTTAQSLKLDGTETYDIVGLDANLKPQQDLTLQASRARTARWRTCRSAAALIRPSRLITTSTAAFCLLCCGSWWRRHNSNPFQL